MSVTDCWLHPDAVCCQHVCEFQPIHETDGRSGSVGWPPPRAALVKRPVVITIGCGAWSDASSELRHDAGTDASRDSFRLCC